MLNDHKKEILNNESSSTRKAVIFLMLSNAQFFNLFFNQFTLKSDNQNQKKKEELLFINVKTFKTYSRVKRANNDEKRTKPDEHEI